MVHYPNRKSTEARNRDYYKFGDKRYIIQIVKIRGKKKRLLQIW